MPVVQEVRFWLVDCVQYVVADDETVQPPVASHEKPSAAPVAP